MILTFGLLSRMFDANYFVLIEKTKYGSDFKSLLWNNIIFYCYLDKFMTPEKDKFFDTVFKKELEKVIANSFVLPNAEQIFREALTQTRASLSSTARRPPLQHYNEQS